jgi:hypothetical protein
MPKVVVKGESVYKCTVCARSIRVSTNKQGLDVLQRCNITYGCLGKLRRVTLAKEINDTPAFPPEVQGVQDWFQRKVLYTHNQPVQSSTWLLQHNLANKPKVHTYVTRYVDGKEQLVGIDPATEVVIDLNTIQLTFATAESGLAQCIGLSSQNATNPSSTAIAAPSSEPFQLSSNNAEITIATLDSSPLVGIAVTYLTSGTAIDVTIEYAGIPVIPSATSPWAGASTAVINGKQYTLRSFNLRTTPLAPAYFAAGAVPEGSRFYISNYQGSPPGLGDCLFLLGKPPYATVDRITDRYIDAQSINPLSPELYYSFGVAMTQPHVIKQTYPLILVV